jgi:excisionase family DNA binding protein
MDTYTVAEAAELLRLHPKTVVKWCRDGRLEGAAYRLGSRKLGYAIPRASVDALLQAGLAAGAKGARGAFRGQRAGQIPLRG